MIENIMQQDLVDVLPERLERALAEVLTPGETIHIKLKGAQKQALVCTDRKVVILKAGFATGNSFGANTFQMPYGRIGGAEVKFHLLSGYFELSSSGVENTEKSYWSTGGESSNPWKAPNCLAIVDREQATRFRAACDFILTFQPGQAAISPSASGQSDDLVDMLERLGSLKDRGLLTEEEFQAKKSELMRPSTQPSHQEASEHIQASVPSMDQESLQKSAEADAIIAKYVASRNSFGGPIDHDKPTAPVFGKRK